MVKNNKMDVKTQGEIRKNYKLIYYFQLEFALHVTFYTYFFQSILIIFLPYYKTSKTDT